MNYQYKEVKDRSLGLVHKSIQFDGTEECRQFIKETANLIGLLGEKGGYVVGDSQTSFYFPEELYHERFIETKKSEYISIDYEAKDKLYGTWKEFCVICQEFKKVAKKAMDKNKHKHKFTDSDFEGSDMLFHKLTRYFLGNPEHEDTLDDMVGYLQLMIKNRRERNNTTVNQDSFEKKLDKERNLNVYKGRIISVENNIVKIKNVYGIELEVEVEEPYVLESLRINQLVYFLGEIKDNKIKFIAKLDPQFMDLEDFKEKLLKNKPDRLDGINHE